MILYKYSSWILKFNLPVSSYDDSVTPKCVIHLVLNNFFTMDIASSSSEMKIEGLRIRSRKANTSYFSLLLGWIPPFPRLDEAVNVWFASSFNRISHFPIIKCIGYVLFNDSVKHNGCFWNNLRKSLTGTVMHSTKCDVQEIQDTLG